MDARNRNFMTVKQVAEKYPAFPQGSVRWLVFTMPPGFDKCMRRIGRKILIEENGFLEFVDQQKVA